MWGAIGSHSHPPRPLFKVHSSPSSLFPLSLFLCDSCVFWPVTVQIMRAEGNCTVNIIVEFYIVIMPDLLL